MVMYCYHIMLAHTYDNVEVMIHCPTHCFQVHVLPHWKLLVVFPFLATFVYCHCYL